MLSLINKNKRHYSLQRIILLITLVFTILIGGILSFFSAIFYNDYMQRVLLQNTDANLSFMADSINRNITEVFRLISFCQTHNYIGEFMNYDGSSSSSVAIKAHERLNEEYLASSVNPYIHRIIIGNNHDRYLQIVDAPYSVSDNVCSITRTLDVYQQIESSGYDFSFGFIPDPYMRKPSLDVLLLVRPISYQYSFVRGGFVCFSLRSGIFTSPMQYYSMAQDSALFLTLGEHIYLMEENSLIELDSSTITYHEITNTIPNSDSVFLSFHDSADGSNGLLVTKPLQMENCYITQLISGSELKSHRPFYLVIIIVVTFLIVCIGFLLSIILYRILYVPVMKIQKRMQLISMGDFSRDASIEWDHELGDIGRGINDLSQNIVSLMDAKIQDEKAKKDLEYQMLQNQINPHFLYNTLNSIKWMAVTQGAEGIAEMTTALSRLLRSISKGTQLLIPIRDELLLVEDYFTIQQYRYGGTLKLNITVEDDSLYDCSIIKFTLQPLVENAIFHGIEPKQSAGTISIHVAFDSPESICISVEDNGIGISQDKIEQILNGNTTEKSQFFKEIGIMNIQKRIQYEFGSQYGISIESEVNSFTRMTVRIPKKKLLS
ncbi:MAG: sensor histidine kinase [Thermoflexaceae bacterium]|nr:sensor histidine kinase [Thermoflexaceae bacterium]